MRRFPITLTVLAALVGIGSVQAPELDAQDRASAVQPADSVVAQVAQVYEDSLRVRTDDGRSMAFVISEDTRVIDSTGVIDAERTQARLEELAVGDHVVVHYRPGEMADQRVATTIDLREVQIAQLQQREQVTRQAQLREREQVRQQERLPATSSNLPLVALLGLLGIAAATGMVARARRSR